MSLAPLLRTDEPELSFPLGETNRERVFVMIATATITAPSSSAGAEVCDSYIST